MSSYRDLKSDSYYLIRADQEAEIELIAVVLQTKATMLLRGYLPESRIFFRLKEETIYKVVEELDEEKAHELERLFHQEEKSEEEYFEFEEEEEDE